ncbi:MAG TPA: fumarate/nitrate reduction transcriptional regulator Fnr [Acidiferrobacteraceae bacterium]|nr:fumarate/nitrate reduction transcriptional regulator Fnr [Acidiferrobacteraceae bacterium]
MNNHSKVIDIKTLKVSCTDCSLSELCLPRGLNEGELEKLDNRVLRKKPIQPGDQLFGNGLPGKSLYAVRSGAFKTYELSTNGDEQILGFHLPGELIGFDALADNYHHCTATALVTSSACEIPLEQIQSLCNQLPGLQHQMMRIIGKEVNVDHEMLVLLGKKSAEERLATFFLNLSRRYQDRKLSPYEFNLPMSRMEIANYLGLTIETVSRIFTRFQKQKLIDVNRRLVHLKNIDELRSLVMEDEINRSDVS